MKHAALFLASAMLALTACERPASETSDQAAAKAEPTAPAAATAPAKHGPRRLSAEDVARIGASGKTGLWADPAEVCSNRLKRRAGTTLEWNVQATGTKTVVVYLMEGQGKVRRVTNGDAIGGKPVGGWVRPGTTFVIRAPNSAQDLGKVVIGKKDC